MTRTERAAVAAGDRGHVDDHPASALDHRPGDGLRAQERALQIELNDLIPASLSQFQQSQTLDERTSVVDQNVNRAERRDRLIDHPPNVYRPGHVGSERDRASARGDYHPLRVFRARLVTVVIYGHCRAGFRERNSGSAADAGTCARYYRDFA